MPGFGYSMPVIDRGWTMARVARAYDVLMRGLGYDAYGVHGSDGGAMVARELGDPRARRLPRRSTSCSCSRSRRAIRPRSTTSGPRSSQRWSTCSGSSRSVATTRSTPHVPKRSPWGCPTARSGSWRGTSCSSRSGTGQVLVTPDQILAEVTFEWLTNTSASARALPLRGSAQQRPAAGEPRLERAARGRRVHRRLPDDPVARRTRQRRHRAVRRRSPRAVTTRCWRAPPRSSRDLRAFFREGR